MRTPAERRNLIAKALSDEFEDFVKKAGDEVQTLVHDLWKEERDSLNARHDQEIGNAAAEIVSLREEIAALNERLDQEKRRANKLDEMLRKVRAMAQAEE